jgi:hypothetical protein
VYNELELQFDAVHVKTSSLQAQVNILRRAAQKAKDSAEAQQAALLDERARLAAEHARAKQDSEGEIAMLKNEVAAAAAKLEDIKIAVEIDAKVRGEVMYAAEGRLVAAETELGIRTSRIEELKVKQDELQAENARLSAERIALWSKLSDARVAAAYDYASLAMHAVQARQDDIKTIIALEDRRSGLTAALTAVCDEAGDVEPSLYFSIAEHHFHLDYCNAEDTTNAARLASVQTALSRVLDAKAAKSAVVTALRDQLTKEKTEHSEELAGLETRLKWVSEGYEKSEKRRKETEKELRKMQWGYMRETKQHREACRAYRGLRKIGESFADDLMKTNEKQKAKLALLETEVAELETKNKENTEIGLESGTLQAMANKAEEDLADAYDALTEKEIHLSKLKETLAGLKEQQASLEAEHYLDQMRFAGKLKKTHRHHDELREYLIVQRLYHKRIAKGKWRAVVEDDVEENSVEEGELPEFVQGSSRDATPERDDEGCEGDASYLSTPSLTNTSGGCSRVGSRSPGSPQKNPEIESYK